MIDVNLNREIEVLFSSIDPTLKNKAISFAAGAAIGRKMPIPNDKLQGSDEQYNIELIQQSNKYISIINELILVDVPYTKAVLKAVYGVRYKARYPDSIITSENECITCDLFDIPSLFKDVCTEGLNQVKKQIVASIDLIASALISYDGDTIDTDIPVE